MGPCPAGRINGGNGPWSVHKAPMVVPGLKLRYPKI
jgi:hypothetical protein